MSVPRMPWGKFRNLALSEIESSYLIWVLDHAERVPSELRRQIRAELGARFASPSSSSSSSSSTSSWRSPCPDPTLAADVVSSGYKALAHRHHPDHGGDTVIMQRLNAVIAWLRSVVPQ